MYTVCMYVCAIGRADRFAFCARDFCVYYSTYVCTYRDTIAPPHHRAGWVELEEDDTIFKCVSVLQARAPTPLPGTSPPAASAGSARGHGLMEGLMGLKRWVGRHAVGLLFGAAAVPSLLRVGVY